MLRSTILLFILLFALGGCLPADSKRGLDSQENESSKNNNGDFSGSTFEGSLKFVHSGQNVDQINLASTFSDVIYLRGSAVTQFFTQEESILSKTYCLILNFENIIIDPNTGTNGSRQLRVRATPTSYFDFTEQAQVQVMKLAFNDSGSSSAVCQGSFGAYNSASPNQVFYSTASLCPLCNSTIEADNLFLARVAGVSITSDTELMQSGTLALNISHEVNGSGGSGPNSCTIANCNTTGYCCDSTSAQCIQHAGPKPGAEAIVPEYGLALAAIIADPSTITQYPQLFYICPGQVPPPNGGGSGSDVVAQIQSDYKCAEEARANAFGNPYQQFLNTTPTTCDVAVPGSCECKYDIADAAEPTYYISVLERLYDYCQCQGANALEKFNNCSSFYYKVLASNNIGEPTQFECGVVTTPGFDPNITLNSRSVPHRFFSQAGNSIDDLVQAPIGTLQEGDTFEYIPGSLIFPLNGSFNMNSILGTQQIDLSKALPAKVTTVEQGQTYIITNTGSTFYIPCPTCPTDSWFQAFRAWPNTITQGLGLQSYGHTTSRDTSEFNNTLGNYEDTIFGRACFVPPTMLPFSQTISGIATAQQSRLARLKTQSAMFANGYQRDWFGFNLGAVIGSFDGVSWFAIGKNRLVQAKSNKLFLAINAPFGDLASPSIHNLTIQAYIPGSQAAEFDYNPNYPSSSAEPLQNMGGSCQRYHICEKDSDCVTQLGWEYVCAESMGRKTHWPSFSNGSEQLNLAASPKGILGILQQDSMPAVSTTKRCVYRGAGSPCVTNIETVLDEQLRRSLTCAPNFYCPSPASPVFNKEVARFAAPLGDLGHLINNHIFGQDANILGRPLHYIKGADMVSLPGDIRQALRENILANNTVTTTKVQSTAQVSLCRPGRSNIVTGATINTLNHSTTLATLAAVPSLDPVRNHSVGDSLSNTDYISQISTTNVNEYSATRYMSCPVLSDEGDYLHLEEDMVRKFEPTVTDANSIMINYIEKSLEQNISGRETLSPGFQSPYSFIEGPRLDTGVVIATPSLVENACLRRAGAVCHTDLDCSPGKLHATLNDLFDISYFGNEAEKAFWNETLVCGQADEKPLPGLSTFLTHNITKNRCCREIGNDITIYSANTPEMVDEGIVIDTKKSGYLAPNALDRYSRLASEDYPLDTNMTPALITNTIPLLEELLAGKSQWQTINDVASRTCCGQGWVRKFSNNTHDWSNPVKATFSTADFACLNYMTPFARFSSNDLSALFGIPTTVTNSGRTLLCDEANDNSDPNCIQIPFAAISEFVEEAPTPLDISNPLVQSYTGISNYRAYQVCSTPLAIGCDSLGPFAPYTPRLFTGAGAAAVFTNAPETPGMNTTISIKLPSYIPQNNIPIVTSTASTTVDTPISNAVGSPAGLWNFDVSILDISTDGAAESSCGISNVVSIPAAGVGADCNWIFDNTTGKLTVSITNGVIQASIDSGATTYAIRISFLPPGIYQYRDGAGDPLLARGMIPGSAYFYLKRLAKMELAGIPQIHHEAMYCNDNQIKLVPGLYNSDLYAVADHNELDQFLPGVGSVQDAALYADPNPSPIIVESIAGAGNNFITSYKDLATNPIFSEKEFTCCKKLNSFVSDANFCCSGHAVALTNNSTSFQCKLPAKTDVSLYFNKFISGEGISEELQTAGISLTNADFDTNTGEPLLSETVFTKLKALATNFCDSGNWRLGGAFGSFAGQPNVTPKINNTLFSITDSFHDKESNVPNNSSPGAGNQDNGFQAFTDGYRWNHHVYCSD